VIHPLYHTSRGKKYNISKDVANIIKDKDVAEVVIEM
jgi:hypothetical protein